MSPPASPPIARGVRPLLSLKGIVTTPAAALAVRARLTTLLARVVTAAPRVGATGPTEVRLVAAFLLFVRRRGAKERRWLRALRILGTARAKAT